jgi:hypothetical protein
VAQLRSFLAATNGGGSRVGAGGACAGSDPIVPQCDHHASASSSACAAGERGPAAGPAHPVVCDSSAIHIGCSVPTRLIIVTHAGWLITSRTSHEYEHMSTSGALSRVPCMRPRLCVLHTHAHTGWTHSVFVLRGAERMIVRTSRALCVQRACAPQLTALRSGLTFGAGRSLRAGACFCIL